MKAQDQMAVQDVELAVDIINWGIASGHARYFSTKASGRSVTPRLLTLCSEPSAPLEFDIPRFQRPRMN